MKWQIKNAILLATDILADVENKMGIKLHYLVKYMDQSRL